METSLLTNSDVKRLVMLHWLASKVAEGHFGVHLTHHLAQFRARLEKLINFPDLGQIAKVCLVSALP
ncbi:MAG: hypothetical protein WB820_10970 [Rhodoplanes sp.]|jgi:hypothetical protein